MSEDPVEENFRKLASVQLVESVHKHPNADTLDIVQIRGWNVITKMGEFEEGDEVVYFEIDSFLPIRSEYEFLRKSCYRNTPNLGEGFRLRAIKLRGEVSMGLVMPLYVFGYGDEDVSIGDDLTEVLGVQKWEPSIPTSLGGHAKGSFPFFIRKTDQERVQNCYKDMRDMEYEYNNGQSIVWYMEEKMDGSSCSMYYHNGSVGICSRNLELKLDDEFNEDNAFIKTAKREGFLKALDDLKLEIAIQAELCGPGIQGNLYKLTTTTLFVFDVWLISEQRYASVGERLAVLDKFREYGVNVQVVPQLGKVTFNFYLEESLEMADGRSKVNPDVLREGIVFKSEKPYGIGGIKSFKAVSTKFLLDNEDK